MFPENKTPMANASIDWTREGRPRSSTYDDIYSSGDNPIEESRHVFLDGNNLPLRFQSLGNEPFIIGECGFGFGLNFLVCAESFVEKSPPGAILHYLGIERHPVRYQELERYYLHSSDSDNRIRQWLLDHYTGCGPGIHRFELMLDGRLIRLDLIYADAQLAIEDTSLPEGCVDAWFLDGFSPDRNPELWSPRLCHAIARATKPQGTLATYTAAGHVRRSLEKQGFTMDKRPGFGNKRHMLSGTLNSSARDKNNEEKYSAWTFPWQDNGPSVQKIAIIGAGLAGCHTAHALAKRGYAITVFDTAQDIAAGASGNPRGIVHFNPALNLTHSSRFRLNAFIFAIAYYDRLSGENDFGWKKSGVLQLPVSKEADNLQKNILDAGLYDHLILDDSPSLDKGLFFPQAGSLNPGSLCRILLHHHNIDLELGSEVTSLAQTGSDWILTTGEPDKSSATFDAVVICNSYKAKSLGILPDYPFNTNHGRVDIYRSRSAAMDEAEMVLTGKGYLIPFTENGEKNILIGGSVAQGPVEDASDVDGLAAENRTLARILVPELDELLEQSRAPENSRTATRCTSRDRLPLAGPVEDTSACLSLFASYRRNARKNINASPAYIKGLYLNTAHGSSGITSTPILGEYLAALINGDPLPLSGSEIAAIHPLRYLIRNLKKQDT